MIDKVHIDFNETEKLLKDRGLEDNGPVQQFIDSEVLRHNDPYVPKDTGELIRSGIKETKIGSGLVKYKTDYARKLYYSKDLNYTGAPTRGWKWFERMKADHKEAILKGARQRAGAVK